jgi:hypothetical protein
LAELMFPKNRENHFFYRLLHRMGFIQKPFKDYFREIKGYTDFSDFYRDYRDNAPLKGGMVEQRWVERHGSLKGAPFEPQRGKDNPYRGIFAGCEPSECRVPILLANKKRAEIDMISLRPQQPDTTLPGYGRHILFFWGTNSYYEQQGLMDMAVEAKATGAVVHTFNYPGMNRSTGQVREANDLVNAGIGAVNCLLKQGVHPHDLILQGNCYGAAVAQAVKQHVEKTQGVRLRLIIGNTFKSLKALGKFNLRDIRLFGLIPFVLKLIAKGTGWHVKPAARLAQEVHLEDQLVLQREGDLLLGPRAPFAQSKKVLKTNIAVVWLRVKQGLLAQVKNKDPHLARLLQCETQTGGDVFLEVINPFLKQTNLKQVDRKPDNPETLPPPEYLASAVPKLLTRVLSVVMFAVIGLIVFNPWMVPAVVPASLVCLGIVIASASVIVLLCAARLLQYFGLKWFATLRDQMIEEPDLHMPASQLDACVSPSPSTPKSPRLLRCLSVPDLHLIRAETVSPTVSTVVPPLQASARLAPF